MGRDAKWAAVYVGVDRDAANAELIMRWAIEYSDALRPYSMGGSYVNFMMDEGQGRVQATYGANLQRLAEIKAKYDRDNVFHVNQNIVPARASRAAASVPSAAPGIGEGADRS